ncbi:MAG: hypothetical protein HY360_09710 [Verrucomicrobia bacterium]|nr:hypothetical protein [Verrucomicrobiota bacterium]
MKKLLLARVFCSPVAAIADRGESRGEFRPLIPPRSAIAATAWVAALMLALTVCRGAEGEYRLADFGPVKTVAEAQATLEDAVKQILAKGGGALVVGPGANRLYNDGHAKWNADDQGGQQRFRYYDTPGSGDRGIPRPEKGPSGATPLNRNPS